MDGFLKVVGVIAALLVVAVVTILTVLAIKGTGLDKESKAYAEASAVAIATDLTFQEFVTRESPELAAASRPAQLNELYNAFRRLGPYKSNGGCKGDSNMSYVLGRPTAITAVYSCNLTFEQGPATFKLSLIKHGGFWKLAGFSLNPPEFASDE